MPGKLPEHETDQDQHRRGTSHQLVSAGGGRPESCVQSVASRQHARTRMAVNRSVTGISAPKSIPGFSIALRKTIGVNLWIERRNRDVRLFAL